MVSSDYEVTQYHAGHMGDLAQIASPVQCNPGLLGMRSKFLVKFPIFSSLQRGGGKVQLDMGEIERGTLISVEPYL